MPNTDSKALLQGYLQEGRNAMLWKLDGLSEYDQRRPLTRTGTNLLGLVKHLAGVEGEYFTKCFDRPIPPTLAWVSHDLAPNADMWASAEQTAGEIIGMYRDAWASTDATIAGDGPRHPGNRAVVVRTQSAPHP